MSAEKLAALALIGLYDERIALTRALANDPRPTGVMAKAILDKGAELDEACEVFRKRFYPRRHRVIVGLSMVISVSKSGRTALIFEAGDPS